MKEITKRTQFDTLVFVEFGAPGGTIGTSTK